MSQFPDRTNEIAMFSKAAREAEESGNYEDARVYYMKWVESVKQQNINTGGELEKELERAKQAYSDFVADDPFYDKICVRIIPYIKDNPDIIQTELYKVFPDYNKSDLSYVLYFAEQHGKINREKKGRSYALSINPDYDVEITDTPTMQTMQAVQTSKSVEATAITKTCPNCNGDLQYIPPTKRANGFAWVLLIIGLVGTPFYGIGIILIILSFIIGFTIKEGDYSICPSCGKKYYRTKPGDKQLTPEQQEKLAEIHKEGKKHQLIILAVIATVAVIIVMIIVISNLIGG